MIPTMSWISSLRRRRSLSVVWDSTSSLARRESSAVRSRLRPGRSNGYVDPPIQEGMRAMSVEMSADADRNRTAHPFDYYREGMPLRPAPQGFAADRQWLPLCRFLLSPWRDVQEAPRETPLTRLHADHRWQSDELMDDVVRMFEREGPARGRALFEQALEEGIVRWPIRPVNWFVCSPGWTTRPRGSRPKGSRPDEGYGCRCRRSGV
jgi:hypothetical protein